MLERLAGFLFPPACVGCQIPGERYLCPTCRSALRSSRSLVAGAELVTLGSYEGVLRTSLKAVKQQGHKGLARELAVLAAEAACRRWGSGPSRAVYGVRPSRTGQRFRGFSLPAMMEEEILRRTEWSALSAQLAACFPEGQSSSQGLSLAERLARQRGPQVTAGEGFERGPLLILDDVVTTGATLAAAVETARALGFQSICCLALAVASDE